MRNFSWLIEGVIAGMGQPGGYGDDGWAQLKTDLRRLQERGITAIVSLTEAPLHREAIKHIEFEYLHLPIADMGTPAMEEIDLFVAFVEQVRARRKGVVVHCGAGVGRTGMMLACYLVSQGETTQKAIETVRAKRQGSMETADQELLVYDYEQYLKEQKHRDHRIYTDPAPREDP